MLLSAPIGFKVLPELWSEALHACSTSPAQPKQITRHCSNEREPFSDSLCLQRKPVSVVHTDTTRMDLTRRSSRARASQPPKSESHQSSTSSSSSTRGDRATRSHKKAGSPRKSTPSNSLSSESAEDAVAAIGNDASHTRRKSARAESADTKSKKQTTVQVDTAIEAEEDADDDEAVRCICEFEEYPGPPQFGEDNKHGIKDGIEEPLITVADVTEDLAGFFLQCDTCKVWQHGGCVGIMNEDTSPEEYYCEQCRKDLHRVCTATNGYVYGSNTPKCQSNLAQSRLAYVSDTSKAIRLSCCVGRIAQSLLCEHTNVNHTVKNILITSLYIKVCHEPRREPPPTQKMELVHREEVARMADLLRVCKVPSDDLP